MPGISYAQVCLPVNQGAVIPVRSAVDLAVVGRFPVEFIEG
ncbi:uncharacterized protein METZ01_LOCUS214613, partial [marine metagenome]